MSQEIQDLFQDQTTAEIIVIPTPAPGTLQEMAPEILLEADLEIQEVALEVEEEIISVVRQDGLTSRKNVAHAKYWQMTWKIDRAMTIARSKA